ncbi:MAG: hypothetical protein DRR06_17505 [Gammaproteobacteria bacterium]|nr:MAG: hypothetical protein DRR06_17505 [Gammaproteobacteria bacterium]
MLQRFTYTLAVFAISSFFGAASAENVDGVADYAYSVFVGTGKYSIQDRTIYVLRVPLEFDIYEFDYGPDKKLGLKLLAPGAIGVTNFDSFEELPELDVNDIQTLSFVPGLELSIPLNEHWQLKPFAQIGFGMDTKSDSESFIWGAGVRSRATYGDDSRWMLGGEFLWAGNNPNGGDSTTSFSRLGLGVEYKIPTNISVFERSISWHLRAFQWYFSDTKTFREPLLPFKLNNSTEVGISFGLDRPIRMLGYDFSQFGVGYEWSGDFEAITVFTTFPF